LEGGSSGMTEGLAFAPAASAEKSLSAAVSLDNRAIPGIITSPLPQQRSPAFSYTLGVSASRKLNRSFMLNISLNYHLYKTSVTGYSASYSQSNASYSSFYPGVFTPSYSS